MWPTFSSECAADCTTSTPDANCRNVRRAPVAESSLAAVSRSSGDMSSAPRALLKRQYTSGSGIMPPALSMRSAKKSASCGAHHAFSCYMQFCTFMYPTEQSHPP